MQSSKRLRICLMIIGINYCKNPLGCSVLFLESVTTTSSQSLILGDLLTLIYYPSLDRECFSGSKVETSKQIRNTMGSISRISTNTQENPPFLQGLHIVCPKTSKLSQD